MKVQQPLTDDRRASDAVNTATPASRTRFAGKSAKSGRVKSLSKRFSFLSRRTSFIVYGAIFLTLFLFVGSSYRAPQITDTGSGQLDTATVTENNEPVAPVATIPAASQVQSAELAQTIAQTANLSVAGNVSQQADTLKTNTIIAQPDASTVAKAQITDLTTLTSVIETYEVKEGDTIASIATEKGVSAETIQWANNLTEDTVAVGTDLLIPLEDGVVYSLRGDDDLNAIAEKYQSNADDIIALNDLDPNALSDGQKILLPGGVLPETERPGYVAPFVPPPTQVYVPTATGGGGSCLPATTGMSGAGGNGYAFGNCTWYAFDRRAQLGRPIPNMWGNAVSWANSAAFAGYRVDRTPEVGAIFQNGGGLGHVGIVERINTDGTIVVSEMNNYACGGFNVINFRLITNPGDYNYIH